MWSNVTRSILPNSSIHGIRGCRKTSWEGLVDNYLQPKDLLFFPAKVFALQTHSDKCIWHVQLRKKCAVQKNRKISISAEMQPSAAAACVKHSSCESALTAPDCHRWQIVAPSSMFLHLGTKLSLILILPHRIANDYIHCFSDNFRCFLTQNLCCFFLKILICLCELIKLQAWSCIKFLI